MTSRTAVFISKECLLWKFLRMGVDENPRFSAHPQYHVEQNALLGAVSLPSYCCSPSFGTAWSLKSGLVCFGDCTFSFSHTVSQSCSLEAIVSLSSWTRKELLQGWALKSQHVKLQVSPVAQSSNGWTDERIERWEVSGSMVFWLLQDSWVQNLCLQTLSPALCKYSLAFTHCKYQVIWEFNKKSLKSHLFV